MKLDIIKTYETIEVLQETKETIEFTNSWNQSKFCKYHNDIRHKTEDCWDLKDEIENWISISMLKDFVLVLTLTNRNPGRGRRAFENKRGSRDV